MRKQRLFLALAVTLSIMVGSVQTVSAHSVYDQNWTYYSPDSICTWGRSEISDGTGGGGYVRVDVEAWHQTWFGQSCGTTIQKSAYQLRVKYTTIKYNDATGNWDWCVNSDWYYNPTNSYRYQIEAWLGEYVPPCGNGNYGNWGGAYSYHNGNWYGDYITTGASVTG